MNKLAERTVLVAGGGSGIGRACALALAAEGARVVVADPGGTVRGDRTESDTAAQVAEAIRALGGDAVGIPLGIGDIEDGLRLIDACEQEAGPPDAVVVPAIVLREAELSAMSQDDWDTVLRVGLTGVFGLVQAALPRMKERGHGRIVTFTSRSGLEGRPGAINYAAAKMGVIGLTRALANETAQFGITANCIAPRARTRASEYVVRRQLDPQAARSRLNVIGEPGDVAPLASYLSSDACQVTGKVFWCAAGELSVYPDPVPLPLIAHGGSLTVEAVAEALSETADID